LARLVLDTNGNDFLPVTNIFPDIYFTNDVAVTQMVQRTVSQPDICFTARDLKVEFFQESYGNFYWAETFERSDTARWQNNSALNQQPGAGGPGIIHPGATITFNTLGRLAFARDREWLRCVPYLSQWGSFDGSAHPPIPHFGPLPAVNQYVLANRVTLIDGIRSIQTAIQGEFGLTYRIDYSTNLVDWTHWYWRDNYEGIFTVDHPIEGPRRFLSVTRELWPW